ncbi:MAG: hypothetical protein ACKPCP_07990, partial [Sphaerospermopsis kisseleviana]
MTEIETLKSDTNHFSKLLQDKHKEFSETLQDRDNYAQTVVNLRETVNTLTTDLTTTKQQLSDSQDIN